MHKVSVYVTPKAGVVDPQGAVIERALPALGHAGVANIWVGRHIAPDVPGMMPRPERVCEDIVGGTDGRAIFQSLIDCVLGG